MASVLTATSISVPRENQEVVGTSPVDVVVVAIVKTVEGAVGWMPSVVVVAVGIVTVAVVVEVPVGGVLIGGSSVGL
eukprot:scaffold28500_cov76-Amphora_coffeaeformis.AAC.1